MGKLTTKLHPKASTRSTTLHGILEFFSVFPQSSVRKPTHHPTACCDAKFAVCLELIYGIKLENIFAIFSRPLQKRRQEESHVWVCLHNVWVCVCVYLQLVMEFWRRQHSSRPTSMVLAKFIPFCWSGARRWPEASLLRLSSQFTVWANKLLWRGLGCLDGFYNRSPHVCIIRGALIVRNLV